MINKLQNPFAAAAVSIVLSLGLGIFLCWRSLAPVLEKLAARPVAVVKLPAEEKHKGWDFWTVEIDGLSNELKDERARLKKQSDLLDQRAARLVGQEKEIEKMRADLDGMRRTITEKVTEIKADEAKNLRTLAQTYTNLTPRAAVAIVKELDDTTAVKILFLMKSDVVGPIFEEMSRTAGTDGLPLAKRAAVLSERLRLMKANKTGPSS